MAYIIEPTVRYENDAEEQADKVNAENNGKLINALATIKKNTEKNFARGDSVPVVYGSAQGLSRPCSLRKSKIHSM